MRKFKGRTVFQGNNVKDEAADVALFAELGSSPANMEAGKALDAYGSMPGNRTSQGDGKQAYTQALQGILTWIRATNFPLIHFPPCEPSDGIFDLSSVQ